jgi:hypothetical protein
MCALSQAPNGLALSASKPTPYDEHTSSRPCAGLGMSQTFFAWNPSSRNIEDLAPPIARMEEGAPCPREKPANGRTDEEARSSGISPSPSPFQRLKRKHASYDPPAQARIGQDDGPVQASPSP